MGKRFSIELDCPPGGIRPWDLILGVLEGTEIKLPTMPDGGCSFGHATWYIPEDQTEKYKEVRDTIKERVKALYNSGKIRYGSW